MIGVCMSHMQSIRHQLLLKIHFEAPFFHGSHVYQETLKEALKGLSIEIRARQNGCCQINVSLLALPV